TYVFKYLVPVFVPASHISLGVVQKLVVDYGRIARQVRYEILDRTYLIRICRICAEKELLRPFYSVLIIRDVAHQVGSDKPVALQPIFHAKSGRGLVCRDVEIVYDLLESLCDAQRCVAQKQL